MTTIGFLEEAPGVKSMARLAVLLMALAAFAIAAATAYVAVRYRDAGTITALAAPLATLGGGIWGALRERSPSVTA